MCLGKLASISELIIALRAVLALPHRNPTRGTVAIEGMRLNTMGVVCSNTAAEQPGGHKPDALSSRAARARRLAEDAEGFHTKIAAGAREKKG